MESMSVFVLKVVRYQVFIHTYMIYDILYMIYDMLNKNFLAKKKIPLTC